MEKKQLLYNILKDIDEGKEIKHGDYDVDHELYGDVLDIAIDEGFVKNAKVSRGGRGNKVIMTYTDGAKITLSGLDYLERNESE